MLPLNELGVAEAPSYHVITPKPKDTPIRIVLKRHKNANCTRQLAIYVDERRKRSGLKRLRCIVNCYDGAPSILTVFNDHGQKTNSFRLKKDYSAHLPHKDAVKLARVPRGTAILVERI